MDLSCRENQVNQLLPVYLMPGEELNETPLGDVSEDFTALPRGKCKARRPQPLY